MHLIILCSAALAGLVIGDLRPDLQRAPLAMAAALGALGGALSWRQPRWQMAALAAAAAALGALRAVSMPAPPPNPVEAHGETRVRITGVVLAPPTRTAASARLTLQVTAIGAAGRDPPPLDAVARPEEASAARAVVVGDPATLGDLRAGQTVALEGRLEASADAVAASASAGAGTSGRGRAPPTLLFPRVLAVDAASTDAASADAAAAGWQPGGATAAQRGAPDARVLAAGTASPDAGWPDGALADGASAEGISSAQPGGGAAAQEGAADARGGQQRVGTGAPVNNDFRERLAEVRAHGEAGIHAFLPEPQASLAAGVLLGGAGQLDADFKRQLQRSGLTHVVAIDGYKEVLVAAAVGALLVPLLGPRLAFLPSIMAIAGYTLLTGAHPSALRAALMVALASVAALIGRIADPLTSLCVALVVMAAFEPPVLLDVGLQLSLSATLGIVLLWPLLRRRLRRLPRLLAEPLGLTVAVTLGTLPVVLATFQVISLVSPLAHILAVPLLPVVLVLSGLLALFGGLALPLPLPPPHIAGPGAAQSSLAAAAHASLSGAAPFGGIEPSPVAGVLQWLATLAAWLAWLPTTVLTLIVKTFGSLPGAALSTGRLPPHAALGLAAALLGWGIWCLPELRPVHACVWRWCARRRPLVLPVASCGACLCAAALLSLLRPDGTVHVQALNAGGGGQAVFIRGPTGRTAVVVLGRVDAAALASGVADHLAVWEHKLDLALALDPAAEGALRLTLERYPADHLLRPASAADTPGVPHGTSEPVRLELGGGGGAVLYAASDGGRLVVFTTSEDVEPP